ncbi:TetR/AcrR family transcriptional regulator [Nocardioides sp. NPDC051685]|uniref:TetR/AcrR family transcriptional regulator n=1 Tax=Nocardioides sp. NPDC051685 TaxID=3364334 RepID=UPI0037B1271F
MTATEITDWASRRPKRADARRNYDAVVEAARAAFARDGVDTSIDEIARAAGVGNATLYRHFPTRDELIAVALAENMAAVHTRGAELVGDEKPLAALREWLLATIDQISTYGGLPDSVLDAAGREGSLLGVTCGHMQETTRVLLKQAQDAGEIRRDVRMDELFDLAAGIAWVISRDRTADAARAARLLDLALDGLIPRG